MCFYVHSVWQTPCETRACRIRVPLYICFILWMNFVFQHMRVEKWLVELQARCRGYLLRKQVGDRLEFFYQHTDTIIKIQVSGWIRQLFISKCRSLRSLYCNICHYLEQLFCVSNWHYCILFFHLVTVSIELTSCLRLSSSLSCNHKFMAAAILIVFSWLLSYSLTFDNHQNMEGRVLVFPKGDACAYLPSAHLTRQYYWTLPWIYIHQCKIYFLLLSVECVYTFYFRMCVPYIYENNCFSSLAYFPYFKKMKALLGHFAVCVSLLWDSLPGNLHALWPPEVPTHCVI